MKFIKDAEIFQQMLDSREFVVRPRDIGAVDDDSNKVNDDYKLVSFAIIPKDIASF